MWTGVKPVIVGLLCGTAMCALWAQELSRSTGTANSGRQGVNGNRARRTERVLTADDGLGVISAALDPKVRRYAGHDCSHLVHAIYEQAGFPYMYASSDDLYEGVQGFQQVVHPQPGDLIVWRGHAGIVVRPSHHVFFSFMSRGPGIDRYDSEYWVSRGSPRFYRYIKNHPCPGCTPVSASYRRERDE